MLWVMFSNWIFVCIWDRIDFVHWSFKNMKFRQRGLYCGPWDKERPLKNRGKKPQHTSHPVTICRIISYRSQLRDTTLCGGQLHSKSPLFQYSYYFHFQLRKLRDRSLKLIYQRLTKWTGENRWFGPRWSGFRVQPSVTTRGPLHSHTKSITFLYNKIREYPHPTDNSLKQKLNL